MRAFFFSDRQEAGPDALRAHSGAALSGRTTSALIAIPPLQAPLHQGQDSPSGMVSRVRFMWLLPKPATVEAKSTRP